MAGQPGRSGGARKGAGRPKKTDATPRTRGSVWMATRERIFKRDKKLCQCDKCKASGNPLAADEVDHIIPLNEGGADEDSNLQALNSECHKIKSAAEVSARAAAAYAPTPAAETPVEFLKNVWSDITQDPRLRVRAAIAHAQIENAKNSAPGKKEQQSSAAKEVGTGSRFSPSAPPKLVAAGGRKVN